MAQSVQGIATYEEFTSLADQLREAAAAYYEGAGVQLMDDHTYDAGIRALQAASDKHGWNDELLETVAGGQGRGDIQHQVPMLSLDNSFDDEEVDAFLERVNKACGDLVEFSVEPKLDGASCSLIIVDGILVEALSRGDGTSGLSILDAVRDADGIPKSFPKGLDITVRGEVVMTKADFEIANQGRVSSGKPPFANPRNAVAGTLMAKHARTYKAPMTFIAYSLALPQVSQSHSEAMAWLGELGFKTACDVLGEYFLATSADEVKKYVADIEARRADFDMDTDGAVIKVDQYRFQDKMGQGSRAPKWAIARKFAPDTRQTALLDIVVEVGRTGNLSFTAKLEPVFVGGTTISSASVHNPSVIAEKGLRLPKTAKSAPQQVIVRRAGEVIPQVVGYANEDNLKTTAPFVPPTECPRCGSDLDTSGLIWQCVRGRECGLEEGIRYAVSRDCLDIEGMGTEVVRSLVESGYVNDVADIFDLDMDKLLTVDRLGEKNATKILERIERAKELPLGRIITSLGIRGTGRSMSRNIAGYFGSLRSFRAATVEQLREVDGIGAVKAISIEAELAEMAPVLDSLEEKGVGEVASLESTSSSQPLTGMSVCVTGAMSGPLASKSRNEINELIEDLGGKASSSVSTKTTFLLTADADSGTGKAKKAVELGIPILSPEEFAARYLV